LIIKRSEDERSIDCNKATAITPSYMQRSNAAQSVNKLHWAYNKTNLKWSFVAKRYAQLWLAEESISHIKHKSIAFVEINVNAVSLYIRELISG